MEILYLLIPISLLLLSIIVVILFWAIRAGQFEDLEGPAHRILMDDDEISRPPVQQHAPHKGVAKR